MMTVQMTSRGRRDRTDACTRMLALLALAGVLFAAPAAAQADDDGFAVFPDLRTRAVFSCGDAKIHGNAVINSRGISTGDGVGDQGHVGSNADITLDGTVDIYGDVLAGPDGEVILKGKPLVTGIVGNADDEVECHLVDLAALEAALDQANDNHLIPLTAKGDDPLSGDDNRSFKIAGNDSLVLPAGTYILSSFEIDGESALELGGEVRILVTGTVKLSGESLVNQGGSPFQLLLWVAGDSVRLQSHSLLRGLLYGPDAQTKVNGGAGIEGAVFSGSADIGGGAIITRIVDDAPPLIEITSPADGDTLTECEVEVTGTVADAETGVTLTINQNPVEVAADGSFSAMVSLWTDPPGTIRAEATDGAGNTTVVEIQVTVPPPVVTLESPPPGSLVGERVVALGGAAGTATEVTVDGVPTVVAGGLWQIASFDLGEDGLKTLEIVGVNCAGSAVVTASLDLDTLPPELAITSPAEGDVFSEDVVTVVGTVFDAHLTGVTVNGIPAAVQDGAFSVADVPLVEGENTLTAVAVDQLGRTTQVAIIVVRHSLPPEVSIDLPAPDRDECLEGGALYTIGGAYWSSYPSTGEGGAPPPVALRIVTSDGNTSEHVGVVAADGQSWSVQNVSLGDGDGVATGTVTATNADLKRTVASQSFRIDGGPPSLELTLDGAPFPASGPGTVPPAGTEAVLFGRALGVRATVSDGPHGAPPAAVMELDGAPYTAGTLISVEGDHLVAATVVDCAGNAASAHAFFHIDLTAPVLMSTDPGDGALLGSGVETFGGTTDTELATATINGAVATVAGTSFSLSPFEWREGSNPVEIVLTDAAGNAASFEREFTVRSIEPTIEIVIGGLPIPAAAIFTRAVAPELRANDPEAAVSATLNGAAFISGTLVDQTGTYTVEATATDALGRTASATATFEIDLAGGPSIAITSPADGAVLTEPVVTVTGTVEGRDPSVNVNGVAAVVSGTSWSVGDLALEPDVLNTLTAGARDVAGRTAGASISVMVDTGGPQVLILEPEDGMLTNRSFIDVAGLVVGGARRTADGTVLVAGVSTPVAADGAFRTLDVPLAGGPNTITAEAVDGHGRTGGDSVTVHGDLEPPTIFLLADGQPLTDGATFGGPISLGVEVADDTGVPPTPEVRLNGRLQDFDGPAVEIPVAEDGGYAVAVAAADLAGNERRVERAFSISGGGCALSELDPSSGSVVAGNAVTIRGRGGGATSVTVRVPQPGTDPVAYQEYPAQLADGTFVAGDVPLPAEGDNALELECADAAGTTVVAKLLIHRLADGDGPVVEILVLSDGHLTAERSVTVEGTVSDGGASLTVNGLAATVAEQPEGHGVFSAEVPLAEGPNIVVARAADAAGRTGRDRVAVWLDTRAPQVRINTPENSSWLGPGADGAAVVDVTGLVDLHAEPNLDSVTVSTPQGTVTAVVDPATGVFTAAAVPLDPALAPADTQTITATATDTLGNQGTSSVGVHFDADGPALVLTAPPDLERYSETSPAEIPVTGDAWAAEGAQISVNGATLDPLSLVWDGPGADGRLHAA
jgi:hypothetical protein